MTTITPDKLKALKAQLQAKKEHVKSMQEGSAKLSVTKDGKTVDATKPFIEREMEFITLIEDIISRYA